MLHFTLNSKIKACSAIKIGLYPLIFAFSLFFISCSLQRDLVPAYKPPANMPLAPVKLPPVQEKFLANGLKVIAIQHSELPVVSFNLLFKTGAAFDPAGKAGLASFTADLLTKGTKTRSAVQIAQEIDFIGGNLSSGADWDRSSVSCQVLKRHFDKGLELFSDVILNPVFASEEIERLRLQKISSYVSGLDSPSNLADQSFAEFLYQQHPFGFPLSGSKQTLENITPADIQSFYQKYYAPNNAVLVVAGDIDPPQIFQIMSDTFKEWSKKELQTCELPPLPDLKGYKVLLVNKPEATQAQIRIGHYGIARSCPEFFSISLMNYIFGGGGFSSRLMKVVRADLGLTYGVYSFFEYRTQAGPFSIETFTKNESVGQAIDEILKQMKRMKAEMVADTELADAQSYMTGSYPMRFETPDQLAGQLLSVELYGLGSDYIEKYRSRVQGVSRDQVLGSAQKYLHPEDLVIVVVGEKNAVYDQLCKYGEVTVKEIE